MIGQNKRSACEVKTNRLQLLLDLHSSIDFSKSINLLTGISYFGHARVYSEKFIEKVTL